MCKGGAEYRTIHERQVLLQFSGDVQLENEGLIKPIEDFNQRTLVDVSIAFPSLGKTTGCQFAIGFDSDGWTESVEIPAIQWRVIPTFQNWELNP